MPTLRPAFLSAVLLLSAISLPGTRAARTVQTVKADTPVSLAWQTQCADCPILQFAVGAQGIRLDSQGHVHAAYLGDYIYYSIYNGITWNTETLDRGPGMMYNTLFPAPALALDKNNAPHIAYVGQSHTLQYAWRTAGGWVSQTIPSPIQVSGISLALDSKGNPHIVFNSYYLMYASWTGSSWQMEALDVSGDTEFHCGLAIDSNDKPNITYFYDRGDRRELRYLTKVGNTWAAPQVVDFADYLGEYNSIAVDSLGNPHITYRDATHSQVKHAHWGGPIVGWQIEVIDSSVWWLGATSTAIDKAGHPHISYATPNGATYAYWSGTAWVTQTLRGNIWYTSLALDQNDNPHLAYYSWDERALIHAQLSGAQWNTQSVNSVSQTGRYGSLALDTNGSPHISYIDYGLGSLRYAHADNGLWGIEILDQVGKTGGYTHLALDQAGLPHISYYDGNAGSLKYAYQSGQAWITQTVDNMGKAGSYTSLELDKTDQPHISYYDSQRGSLGYAWWNGSAWVTQTVDSAGNTGTYTSLALDSSGAPHIGYYDTTQHSLKYARWIDGAWLTETVDNSSDVGAYVSLAIDKSDIPHVSYYDATRGALKYAVRTGGVWLTQTVDRTSNVGSYSSLAIDSYGNPHISYSQNNWGGLKYAHWTGSQWVIQYVEVNWEVGAFTALALNALDQPTISYADIYRGELHLARGMPIWGYLPLIGR